MSNEIAYLIFPDNRIAFPNKRIGINFVPRGECTNRCLFCALNISAIKSIAGHEILLDKEYSVGEIVDAVSNIYLRNSDCSEIFISGTIGEPLLYFDKLIQFISKTKEEIPLPVRLNTNGQFTIINSKYSSQEACMMFEKVGLDSIVISLNAINEKDYNIVCNPKNSGAFESVVDFVKAFNQSRIETFVSFVDYPINYCNLPVLDKNKIKTFCEGLGLNESQIVYRPLIC